MKLFNKIAIIGVGLIGGSMGLALRKKKLCNQIIGISRHKKTISLAKKIKAIDKGVKHLDMIKEADLVILATPVSAILNLAPRISKIIKPDCIVSDVGSTKEEIVSKLDKVFARYVGSHPIAGSEKRGIINANPNIFRNSLCILTPTKNTDPAALRKIKILWQKLGVGGVFNLAPATHDKILSSVSHLPHILAFSLIETVPRRYFKFASNGLKDTTRIAASDSELWVDIFLSNRKNMLQAIECFEKNLSKIKSVISKKDRRSLSKILKKAKHKRDALK